MNATEIRIPIEEAIEELKSLYRNGAYEEAYHLATDILKFAPHNKLARKILIRADKKFTSKHHTKAFALIFAFISIGLVLAFLFHQSITQTLENKEKKIAQLIDEIGELKSQDLLFFDQIKENQGYLSKLDLELERKIISANRLRKRESFTTKKEKEEKETFSEEMSNTISEQAQEIEKQKEQLKLLLNKNLEIEQKVAYLHSKDHEHYLLLGVNGGLTDTIILSSLDKKNNELNMVSIPRDLQVAGRKINEYYNHFGIDVLKNYISEIVQIPINGYAVVDFGTFEKVIDHFGGIDVEVERDIVDPNFPDGNYGTITYEIAKGKHHLSGAEALRYARSRKSTSDYDRSRRQQKIIMSFIRQVKKSVAQKEIAQVLETAGELVQGIETDLDLFEIAKKAYSFKDTKIISHGSLNKNGLIYGSNNIKGQSILLPRDKSFATLGQYIRIKLGIEQESSLAQANSGEHSSAAE